MGTTRTAKQSCPGCGYRFDAHSQARDGDATPQPGDLTVCINCGGALVFGANLRVRPLTEAELSEIDPATLKLLSDTTAAVLEMQRRRRAQ
jgi:hypothetical protein